MRPSHLLISASLACAAVASLLLACGSTRCSPSSCSGCCDENDSCQPGVTSLSCGSAGGLCSVCSPAEFCQAGICTALSGGGGHGGSSDGGGPGGNADAGADAGDPANGGDAGTSGGMDAGSDGGVDAGQMDAGVTDAGSPDAGAQDAGTPDAGTPDAGTPDAGTPDAGGTFDAGGAPDAGPTCTASASYGNLGTVSGTATNTSFAIAKFKGNLNADPLPDRLTIELYEGYGVFAAGVTPGTYALTGDETDYSLCGACVLVYTDIDPISNDPTDKYMASGGSLTITAIDGGFAGSLSNVTFRHVSFSDTDLNDGCFSSISSASFNEPYTP